ncbi:Extragenic suppressor of kinetochore protein-like protein [Emericellopsis cladophorae]|uniref:Extragenic suppressor of kinetochore protein-like protein n=1 Tax=Emericellopsis cladophorae TaxID=2686198 RepID=A0A9P9XW26_9HYPO|nr:Extragenic suppressor of kinetochore protein-like protein [Emericellopsis cladophorae]KAI6778741.1 Extragenic suppressor of kinetochore protein-like protein [Emericellopsis cladophorae]
MPTIEVDGLSWAGVEFRAYTDPSNADSSLAPPSIPPPPPPPPPLNIPPSRARRQLAARLALHQKNNETAEPSSASHHGDKEGGDDDDDDLKDPFADGEDDLDDDDDILREDGRDSWWRGVVRRKASEEERNLEEDNDDEFGDFAMAEDNDEKPDENVVLRPLAVNPAKDGNRSLSGLWPFSTRSEQAAPNEPQSGGESLFEKKPESEAAPSAAVEVKEAKRRTSIEDPDDDEPVKV